MVGPLRPHQANSLTAIPSPRHNGRRSISPPARKAGELANIAKQPRGKGRVQGFRGVADNDWRHRGDRQQREAWRTEIGEKKLPVQIETVPLWINPN